MISHSNRKNVASEYTTNALKPTKRYAVHNPCANNKIATSLYASNVFATK